MNAYRDFQGNPVKLPDAAKLKLRVMAYLREGGELTEAELMGRCGVTHTFLFPTAIKAMMKACMGPRTSAS